MNTRHAERGQGKTALALATLFLGTFVLGSAELLPVGVINVIAADLQVSISAAGALVTAYAIGVAVGGPLLTALTIKLNKRTVLAGALLLCIAGNLAPILVADYTLFVVARAFTGALGGLFVAVAFIVGTSIVPPERMGRAISAVFGGFAVSGALGVPLGTLIGQELGWRGSLRPDQRVPPGLRRRQRGAAIGGFTASAPVIAGLVIAVIAIPVAWATSFLKPPATRDDPAPDTTADSMPEPA
ncbi:MAG: MFS transporter [Thermoactinospora sp.]|nr:MFS transporter [Thermoactinospora sp.]